MYYNATLKKWNESKLLREGKEKKRFSVAEGQHRVISHSDNSV